MTTQRVRSKKDGDQNSGEKRGERTMADELENRKGIIMKTNFVQWVQDGMTHPRVAIYLKVIAVLMLLSGLTHFGSIMGIIGGSWAAKPLLFRIADLLLLPVSLILAWGLWKTLFWAVVAWGVAVLLLQAVPFLFFGRFFASGPDEQRMLYGQVVFHFLTLGILFLLLPHKKRK